VSKRIDVDFDPPFTFYSLADVRAGNAPSNTIDVLGNRKGRKAMAYGRVRIVP
jgi:hypothetical protein